MKLKSKLTGEIGELHFAPDKEYPFTVATKDPADMAIYKSLADLNAEWEDAPEVYWYIDVGTLDEVNWCEKNDDTEADKEIGNYFETREQAEAALEKLKAWKRLKDKGFKFDGFYSQSRQHILWHCDFPYKNDEEFQKDLNFLFGGEE